LPVQLLVVVRVELRVDEPVELQVRPSDRQPVVLRVPSHGQCLVEWRVQLLCRERVRLLVQLRVQLWVGRPPDAFSATYALSGASRVVNRPYPGPWSLDLLSDAATPAPGGQRSATRCGAKCGDWSKACSGPRSGRLCVARIGARSGVQRRTRSAARSVGLTLARGWALSRRCSEAMSRGRSEDRSGIESGHRSRALSGVKTGSCCLHLSPTCSMPGTGSRSTGKHPPYEGVIPGESRVGSGESGTCTKRRQDSRDKNPYHADGGGRSFEGNHKGWYEPAPWPQFCRGVGGPPTAWGLASAETTRDTTSLTTA
jgi:hypothetical protein